MTKMTEARALTESALLDLFGALDAASSVEDFFARADAIVTSPANHLLLPVNPGTPDKLSVISNRAIDVDNAPRVYEYLGGMEPANAADPRLWAYLAFVTYREYMEQRWPLTGDKWKGRVRDRWLLRNGSATRGKLVRHGIARLWWVAHLTYETVAGKESIAKDDPFAYTREVFKSEDRLNALFDREVGAFPAVTKALLNHAVSVGKEATDKYLQRIMVYLTLINGYRDIGMLDVPAVSALIESAVARTPSE